MEKFIARQKWFLLLCIAALTGISYSLTLLFKSGCAGDPKSGVYGDPILALKIEGQSFPFFLGGLCLACAALVFRLGSTLTLRITQAVAFFIFGGLALWFLGVQMEIWGVQHCFH